MSFICRSWILNCLIIIIFLEVVTRVFNKNHFRWHCKKHKNIRAVVYAYTAINYMLLFVGILLDLFGFLLKSMRLFMGKTVGLCTVICRIEDIMGTKLNKG